jgi:hypothetical protein
MMTPIAKTATAAVEMAIARLIVTFRFFLNIYAYS